jgi:hypothetical protein
VDSPDQLVPLDPEETLVLQALEVPLGCQEGQAQLDLRERGDRQALLEKLVRLEELEPLAQQGPGVTPAHRETLEPLVDSIISQKNMC